MITGVEKAYTTKITRLSRMNRSVKTTYDSGSKPYLTSTVNFGF